MQHQTPLKIVKDGPFPEVKKGGVYQGFSNTFVVCHRHVQLLMLSVGSTNVQTPSSC